MGNTKNTDTNHCKTKVEQEACKVFGDLRELTKEEQKDRKKILEKISKRTGNNFFAYY